MCRAPASKAGHVLDSALSSGRAQGLVRNASHAHPSYGCKEALYGPECCVQMSQAPTEQLYVFFTDTVREQIPDTLHLHGYLWRRDRNETDIRNKWGKYSKRGRHPVRLRKAAEGQHHPLSPSLYSSNYP